MPNCVWLSTTIVCDGIFSLPEAMPSPKPKKGVFIVMKNIRFRWGFAAVCIVALSMLVVAAPWASSADEGQNVSPRGGGPSQRFAFFATGFRADERVGYWATAPDGSVPDTTSRQVTANHDGRADWTWRAPSNAMAGVWTIAAKGVKSGRLRTLRVEIITSGGSQPAATAQPNTPADGQGQNVAPRGGSPNTRFAFFATGFRSGERVGLWATAPDGSVRSIDHQAIANKDGRADWSWRAPSDAQAGVWVIAAQGTKSNTLRTLRVEIVR